MNGENGRLRVQVGVLRKRFLWMGGSVDSYVSPAAQIIGKFHIQSKETKAYARFEFPNQTGKFHIQSKETKAYARFEFPNQTGKFHIQSKTLRRLKPTQDLNSLTKGFEHSQLGTSNFL
jgi:hypothetical protein